MLNDKQYLESSVRSQFVLLTVFWWLGFPLSVVGVFVPSIEILSSMAMVATTVFWCILLYRHWLLLQGHGARTTPGKAIGFGFIPLFGFYWWFVAYAGLATDNNRYLQEIGINNVRMSRRLAITDCVLSVLMVTIGLYQPVGAVILIPAMIIGYILVVQQRNCVLAMLSHEQEAIQ